MPAVEDAEPKVTTSRFVRLMLGEEEKRPVSERVTYNIGSGVDVDYKANGTRNGAASKSAATEETDE